jgi:hypothetical protein
MRPELVVLTTSASQKKKASESKSLGLAGHAVGFLLGSNFK